MKSNSDKREETALKKMTDSKAKWMVFLAVFLVAIAATFLPGYVKGCGSETPDEQSVSGETEETVDDSSEEATTQDDLNTNANRPANTGGGEPRQPRQLRLKTQAKDAAERLNRNPF
jgi:hypothetical protein